MISDIQQKETHALPLLAIQNQIEFYFSEGNLLRDEFMQTVMREHVHLCTATASDPDTAVASGTAPLPISVLLTFRKLLRLISDADAEKVVCDAVRNSTVLELIVQNDEQGGEIFYVRRRFALPQQPKKEQVDRTLYLARLPQRCTHESLTEFLLQKLPPKDGSLQHKNCPVMFVSLPTYRSTGESRGFGFIEFRKQKHVRRLLSSLRPEDEEERRRCAWEYFSRYTKRTQSLVKSATQMGLSDPFKTDIKYRLVSEESGFGLCVALSKREWLTYKEEFRQWQQAECNRLAVAIAACTEKYVTDSKCSHVSVATTAPPSESTCSPLLMSEEPEPPSAVDVDPNVLGTVVRITPEDRHHSLYRATIRQALFRFQGDIAYLDVQDLRLEGHVRFKTAEVASVLMEEKKEHPEFLAGFHVHLLDPEETGNYMQRMDADKMKKSAAKKRRACKRQAQLNFQIVSHKRSCALGPSSAANSRRVQAEQQHLL